MPFRGVDTVYPYGSSKVILRQTVERRVLFNSAIYRASRARYTYGHNFPTRDLKFRPNCATPKREGGVTMC
jgi:hypothetical protein